MYEDRNHYLSSRGLIGSICVSFSEPTIFVFASIQLVNASWQAEMKDGYRLGKDHPGVYLGERQALNEDYTHSGFDRGHLNPNGHHAGLHREPLFSPASPSPPSLVQTTIDFATSANAFKVKPITFFLSQNSPKP